MGQHAVPLGHGAEVLAHADDAGGLEGRADLVAALGAALGVSGLHGHNLDALEERVRALPARPPLLLVSDDWAGLAAAHPRATRGALRVVTAHDRAPTVVLLLGDDQPSVAT